MWPFTGAFGANVPAAPIKDYTRALTTGTIHTAYPCGSRMLPII
jgi:hypothetical protein